MSHQRKRKRRLHAESPHCHWCGIATKLVEPGVIIPLDADHATIDHLDDRITMERGTFPWSTRTVLACHGCNSRRNEEKQAVLGKEGRRAYQQTLTTFGDRIMAAAAALALVKPKLSE